MDPKTLASLDPKLRETYERVMGTMGAITPAQSPTPSPVETPAAAPNTVVSPAFEVVNTNPAVGSSGVHTLPNDPFAVNTPTDSILNPDGLTSALNPASPTPNTPNTTDSFSSYALQSVQPGEILPTVPLEADTSSFNLNPMGQKTDVNMPIGNTPITPLPSPASVAASGPSGFVASSATEAKPATPWMRILYIVAGVVFFIIYTFFWIKVFKFPLPF